MRIIWTHGNNHGVAEDVDRAVAENAIGSGMATLFDPADAALPDIAPLADVGEDPLPAPVAEPPADPGFTPGPTAETSGFAVPAAPASDAVPAPDAAPAAADPAPAPTEGTI